MAMKRLYVGFRKWADKNVAGYNWIPIYTNAEEIGYDAYGRRSGDPYFGIPREKQKLEIESNMKVRYWCYEDYGTETVIYKEVIS